MEEICEKIVRNLEKQNRTISFMESCTGGFLANYTVYSMETAKEMAKNVAKFADSNIGVGITGELGNTINKEPKVYYSIYFKDKNEYTDRIVSPTGKERCQMKKEVAENVLLDILKLL